MYITLRIGIQLRVIYLIILLILLIRVLNVVLAHKAHIGVLGLKVHRVHLELVHLRSILVSIEFQRWRKRLGYLILRTIVTANFLKDLLLEHMRVREAFREHL